MTRPRAAVAERVSPELMLRKATLARSAGTRAKYAERGLAHRGELDRTTRAMLLRQLYLSHMEAQRFDEWTVQRSADRVLVSPDPFGGVVIPFEIEAREIAARRFGSHGDLREALRQAERRVLQGTVEGR